MDYSKAKDFAAQKWNESICQSLSDYIRVPNQSPAFDKEVFTNGLQEKALDVVLQWIDAQNIPTLQKRVVTLPGRTPVLFCTIEPTGTDVAQTETILCYSHLDKQPPMLPWAEGLDPYEPVFKDGKLYGRGGADDGYGVYSVITAIQILQAQQLPHARIVILLELCEESGSYDLSHYVDALRDEIGTPSLVVCLDSGCGNYEQLWLTMSLRGVVAGTLQVEVSSEGVHSGMGSGVIPSTMRIIRDLLDRIEDKTTGRVLVPECWTEIPAEHLQYAKDTVDVIGKDIIASYPFLPGVKPVTTDPLEAFLNRAWRPQVSYIGVDGIPKLEQAGNVLRPSTTLAISIRLPPTVNPDKAAEALKATLEANPPYNAKVTFDPNKRSCGFYAPVLEPWLAQVVEESSQGTFEQPVKMLSDGVSIPFLSMLGTQFPSCQFVVLGLLGPESNAHSANESLDYHAWEGITASLPGIMYAHYQAHRKQ